MANIDTMFPSSCLKRKARERKAKYNHQIGGGV
jgi:hypothetical protein